MMSERQNPATPKPLVAVGVISSVGRDGRRNMHEPSKTPFWAREG